MANIINKIGKFIKVSVIPTIALSTAQKIKQDFKVSVNMQYYQENEKEKISGSGEIRIENKREEPKVFKGNSLYIELDQVLINKVTNNDGIYSIVECDYNSLEYLCFLSELQYWSDDDLSIIVDQTYNLDFEVKKVNDGKRNGKIISVHTMKGGVGKTTLVTNLAESLSQHGEVLLLDMDAQNSLTSFELFNKEEKYWDGMVKLGEFIDKPNGPIPFSGSWMSILINKQEYDQWDIKTIKITDHIHLLGGYSNQLSLEQSISSELLSRKKGANTANIINMLVELKKSFDYILVDLNPSLSAMNQLLLKMSDQFISPIIPETYSLIAMRLLRDVILKNLQEMDYIHKKTPEFVGLVINRVKYYGDDLTGSHRRFLSQLSSILDDKVLKPHSVIMLPQLDSLATEMQIKGRNSYNFTTNNTSWREKNKVIKLEVEKLTKLIITK